MFQVHGVHAGHLQLRAEGLRRAAVGAAQLPVLQRRPQRWTPPLGRAASTRRHCDLVQGDFKGAVNVMNAIKNERKKIGKNRPGE